MTDYRKLSKLRVFIKIKIKEAGIKKEISAQSIDNFIINSFSRLVETFGNADLVKESKLDLSRKTILKHCEMHKNKVKAPLNYVLNAEVFKYVFNVDQFSYRTVSAFIVDELNRKRKDGFFRQFSAAEIEALSAKKTKLTHPERPKKAVARGKNVVDYKKFINAEVKRLNGYSVNRTSLDIFVLSTLADFYEFCGCDTAFKLNPTTLVEQYNELVKTKKWCINEIFNEEISKELSGLITSKNLIAFLKYLSAMDDNRLKMIGIFENRNKIGKRVVKGRVRYTYFKNFTFLTNNVSIRFAKYSENSTFALKIFDGNKDITKDLILSDKFNVKSYVRFDRENDKSILLHEQSLKNTARKLIIELSDNDMIERINKKTFAYVSRFKKVVLQINDKVTVREKNGVYKVYYNEIDITNTINSHKLNIVSHKPTSDLNDLLMVIRDSDLNLIEREVRQNF